MMPYASYENQNGVDSTLYSLRRNLAWMGTDS